MDRVFKGFSKRALEILAELPSWDREYFAAHKKEYQAEILETSRDFVVALGALLQERVSEGLQAVPKVNGSLSPIHRDTRFSTDKTLYKNFLMVKFWEGSDRKNAPCLRLRMDPAGVGIASSFRMSDLDRWRKVVDDQQTGGWLAAEVKRLQKTLGAELRGKALKRVPKPYASDHPRGNLLKHQEIYCCWWVSDPPSLSSADFVSWCAGQFEELAGIHHWLCVNFS